LASDRLESARIEIQNFTKESKLSSVAQIKTIRSLSVHRQASGGTDNMNGYRTLIGSVGTLLESGARLGYSVNLVFANIWPNCGSATWRRHEP